MLFRSRHALPETTPLTAHGEFVRAELKRDDEHATSRRPAWRAASILTKAQVDTFLFVRLPISPTVDFSRAACLVLDTWVPEGQRTPNQLLVILHEKNGGDFLAATGRSLGGPGHERTFLPWARFQLAGWSKDGDGELDLQRVDEVRIGWGGYFGSEGETIDFSVALPETGSHELSP